MRGWVLFTQPQRSLACVAACLPISLFNCCNLRLTGLVSLSELLDFSFPNKYRVWFFMVSRQRFPLKHVVWAPEHWIHCLRHNECHIQSLEMVGSLLVLRTKERFPHPEKWCTAEFSIMLALCVSVISLRCVPCWLVYASHGSALGCSRWVIHCVIPIELNHFKYKKIERISAHVSYCVKVYSFRLHLSYIFWV